MICNIHFWGWQILSKALHILVFLSVLLVGIVDEALAEKRVALIIGNSAYKNISALDNPKNDAALMARTLEGVGFDVTVTTDSDLLTMNRAIGNFSRKLRSSGKDTVGLFYYAGHGVQARGANYLVPLGARVENQADLTLETISAADILTHMESAGNKLNLVVLDACRNNPYKSRFRSSARGLARTQAASGTLLAFSAAPGQVADDGTGQHSPYTLALSQAVREPGLSVEQVFKRVRVKVETETGGQQTPWEESSLRGDFYFIPKIKPAPVPATNQQVLGRSDLELSFWNSIANSSNAAVYEEFLRKFPDGTFSGLAKLRLAELKKKKKKQKVAALPEPAPTPDPVAEPAPAEPQGAAPIDKRKLVRSMQSELNRLGCSAGKADGAWGRNSKRALAAFARHAKLKLASLDPAPGTLELLTKQRQRVCPLVCDRRHVAKKGRCVLKACGKNQRLTGAGRCVAKRTTEPKPKKTTATTTNRKKQPKKAKRSTGPRPNPTRYSAQVWRPGPLPAGRRATRSTKYGRLTCVGGSNRTASGARRRGARRVCFWN